LSTAFEPRPSAEKASVNDACVFADAPVELYPSIVTDSVIAGRAEPIVSVCVPAPIENVMPSAPALPFAALIAARNVQSSAAAVQADAPSSAVWSTTYVVAAAGPAHAPRTSVATSAAHPNALMT
jgi:hypothetical protein